MMAYVIRRLLLMIPTIFGIMLVNFVVLQFLPGGPVEQVIAQLTGTAVDVTARYGGGTGGEIDTSGQAGSAGVGAGQINSKYRGSQGLDPELLRDLERQFGLDKPAHERFVTMIGNYLRFDFGESFFRDREVVDLVIDKLPVSISLGLWTTLLAYLISIPLGVAKAVRDGSRFDVWTSGVVVVGNAIPGFLFAVFLIVLFSRRHLLGRLPAPRSHLGQLGGVELAGPDRRLFLAHHAADSRSRDRRIRDPDHADQELFPRRDLQAIRGDRPGQGVEREPRALRPRLPQRHADRNRRLSGRLRQRPSSPVSLLIETIFSLDGLGLLAFEAVLNRDYPIVLGTLYVFTLMGLVIHLIGDLTYMVIDPRIDFESREV